MSFLACINLIFALVLAGASAAPSPTHLGRRAVCTPTAGGSSGVDDTPAIQSAIASCGNGGTIAIPKGTTYQLNTFLSFEGCNGCDFQLEGTLHFTGSTSYWDGKQAQILLKGISGAKVRSLTGSGVIDGDGQESYDLFATNTSYKRPTTFYIQDSEQITVTGIKTINPPNVFYSVDSNSKNVAFSDLHLSATSNSANPAKNTDGFDISGTSVTLDSITVVNDDDCIAFKSGANFVTATNITCTGSHGLSVGSLGQTNADKVSNIYVSNANMINSTKAAGIKTWPHTSGGSNSATVSNVTMTGITVSGCDYAIQIQSCYGSDAAACKGEGTADLSGIVFDRFTGTTDGTYKTTTSNIDCGDSGVCGVTISNYDVKPLTGSGQVLCANTPASFGVACTTGASG